jgi:hypothetical protein
MVVTVPSVNPALVSVIVASSWAMPTTPRNWHGNG